MTSSTTSPPRVRIRIDLGQARAAGALYTNAPARRIEIKVGSTVLNFPAYLVQQKKSGKLYRSFMTSYHDGLRRRLEKRNTIARLKARLQEIATTIVNGQTARLQVTQSQIASLLRALELLVPISSPPLELVAGIYTECVQILRGRSLVEAAKFYAHHFPIDVETRTSKQIYDEMMVALDKDGASSNTLDDLRSRIGNWFVIKFPVPLSAITAAEINTELRKLKVSRRTRNNYRGNVVDFYRFAKQNGDLPKSWSVLDEVPRAKNEPVVKNIFTPEEITKILAARLSIERRPRTKPFIPFIAIAAWAHVRHEEMAPDNPGLPRLDWRDVNFETKEIRVSEDVARKIGMDRIVPMPDNLVAWLRPYAKPNGPVCEISNPTNALLAAAADAGVKWKDNGLRKSSISYRLAVLKDIEEVAEEAGTSPERIRINYKVTIPEREAKRWYGIWPTHADIVQLPLFGR